VLTEALKPLTCLGILLLGCLTVWRFKKKRIFIWSALFIWLLIVLTFYFFRDPYRLVIQDEFSILSPSDGKIIAIDDNQIYPWSTQTFFRISIYLSLFDVHVNRIPSSGRIFFLKAYSGSYIPAFHPEASNQNESQIIGIQTAHGDIYVKQIAGVIARRIVCLVKPMDIVRQGERYGMIRFGSRVEIYIPDGFKNCIKIGDRVKAGETILAKVENDHP
jgi:phosphatidylserine decarboxylase